MLNCVEPIEPPQLSEPQYDLAQWGKMTKKAGDPPSPSVLLGNILTTASAVCGAAAITIEAFKWNLVDVLTPFLMAPLELFAWAAVALMTLLSLVYLLVTVWRHGIRAALPLRVNAVVIASVLMIPFTDIWLKINFATQLAARESVVEMVARGELAQSHNFSVELPEQYRHLSKQGRILVETEAGVTRVFFFTFTGVLDNFSGFMYTSDDRPPGTMSFLGDWFQVDRWRPHWYFCASR